MEDKIECPACNKKLKALFPHVRLFHKMKMVDFLKMYPGTKITADAYKGGRKKGFRLSEEEKRRRSESMKGKNNHFYGKKHSKETREKMSQNHADFTGDKNPLRCWLEKDKNNRIKYSEAMKSSKNNPIFLEKFRIIARDRMKKLILEGKHEPYSNCKHGWFSSEKFSKKFYYQSSYEDRFLNYCETTERVTSLEKSPFCIPYLGQDGTGHNYFPDFFINGSILIEIKPKSMLDFNNNRSKILAGFDFCEKNGYKFLVVTEKELADLDSFLYG